MNRQGTVNDVFVRLGATNHSLGKREINDYYATEPSAVEMLCEKETFNKNIWECACGQGHISKVLIQRGYNVKSTDLIDRGYGIGGIDFLKETQIFDGDIITNPPYKISVDFVEHSLKLIPVGNKVAMLLKIQFLESGRRRKLFDQSPPKYVYVFSKRTNCAKNGDFEAYPSSAICYAWYIWEKGYSGETILRWI